MSGYYILNGGSFADISNVIQYNARNRNKPSMNILGTVYANFATNYNIPYLATYEDIDQYYKNATPISSSTLNTYITGFNSKVSSTYLDLSSIFKIRTIFINSNFNIDSNNSTYFISNNTNFTVTSDFICEIICVGGGAAGGGSSNSYGGGGGANTMSCIASLKMGITYIANIAQNSYGDGQATTLSSSDNSITITARGGFYPLPGSSIGATGTGGIGGSNGTAIGNNILNFNSYIGNNGGISQNTSPSRGQVVVGGVILNTTPNSVLNSYYTHNNFNNTFATTLGITFGKGGSGGNMATVNNGVDGTYGNGGEGSKNTAGLGGPGCIYLNPFTSDYLGTTKISFTKDSLNNMPNITQATTANAIRVGLDYYTYPLLNTNNLTAGTLYTYETYNTSAEATFTLNSGTMNCYVVLVGPGGWGTSLTPSGSIVTGGSGGGIISARFTMNVGETYTIHLDPGTNDTTDGTTRQGFVDISSNNFKLTAYGGNTTSSYTNSTGIPGGSTNIIGSITNYAVSNGGNSGYVTSANVGISATNGAFVYNTTTSLSSHTIIANIQSHIKSQIISAHKMYINKKKQNEGFVSNAYIYDWKFILNLNGLGYGASNENRITNGFSGGGGGSNVTLTLIDGGTGINDDYYNFWDKAFINDGAKYRNGMRGWNELNYNNGDGYGTGGNSAFKVEPDPNNISQPLGGKGGAGVVMIYLSKFS